MRIPVWNIFLTVVTSSDLQWPPVTCWTSIDAAWFGLLVGAVMLWLAGHAAVWSLTEKTDWLCCDVTVRPPVRPQPGWPRPAPAWVVEVDQQDNHEHHHHHHSSTTPTLHHTNQDSRTQLSWHNTTTNSPVDSFWSASHPRDVFLMSSELCLPSTHGVGNTRFIFI